ncbi:hypothetical protein JOS77_11700 [Chromobacterium haemolyticum]|nr:hypothetical protein JOS77_11700 [Chromobacterium haemolyticum]
MVAILMASMVSVASSRSPRSLMWLSARSRRLANNPASISISRRICSCAAALSMMLLSNSASQP